MSMSKLFFKNSAGIKQCYISLVSYKAESKENMTKEEKAVEILSWVFYGTPIDGLPSELQILEAGEMAIKALEHSKNEESAYWYKKGIYPGWLYCSNCGEPWSFNTGAPPYCPCCGKKMRKEEE